MERKQESKAEEGGSSQAAPPVAVGGGAGAKRKRKNKKKQQSKKPRLVPPRHFPPPPPTNADSKKKKAAAPQKLRPQMPYTLEHPRILVLGDGNFSFSLALSKLLERSFPLSFPSIFATVYDSEEILHQKYPDARAIVQELEEKRGVSVHYEVDATDLRQLKPLQGMSFHYVVFNFPHIGEGIKNQDLNIEKNRNVIKAFLLQALHLLEPNGQIHITLRTGMPYIKWNITNLAAFCTAEVREEGQKRVKTRQLKYLRSFDFDPEMYEGYAHRRTIGFVEGISKANNEEIVGEGRRSKTYVFVIEGSEADTDAQEERKKKKENDEEGGGKKQNRKKDKRNKGKAQQQKGRSKGRK
ncbi:Ferredoxin-fold anticodon-binding domain-containing protein 1 [Balamuthia mandrillaris]